MEKFDKLVAIEPVSLVSWGEDELKEYAKEIIMYDDIPSDDNEIIRRIKDADAVLVSYTSKINSYVLESCKNVKYVGMCCSLYSKESANVDISFAEKNGVTVKGIRDYGDRGVVEYVIYQLVRILHGYDYPKWKEESLELLGLKVGIVGLGVSGGMVADALKFLGAEVSYYARSEKPERKEQGIFYKPLKELLSYNDVIITCLNKNVILLGKEEFEALGNGKIMINTSIGPACEMQALKEWISDARNIFCADTIGAVGEIWNDVHDRDNVICVNASAGRTSQAFELLTRKVLDNIKEYLEG